MGRKKTIIGTSLQRVVDDDNVPDSIQSGLTKAILSNEGIPETVMEELFGSIGLKADKYYDLAASGEYPWGVPAKKLRTITVGRTKVQEILESIEGSPISMEYIRLGPPNYIHLGWMALVQDYGYNAETNELPVLTAAEETTVYLHDLILYVSQGEYDSFNPGVLDVWGIAAKAGPTVTRQSTQTSYGATTVATPVVLRPTIDPPKVFAEVSYKRLVAERVDHELTHPIGSEKIRPIELNLSAVDPDLHYYQVRYKANGITKFWMYAPGTGIYPDLDEYVDPEDYDAGSFYPFLYFRYDYQSEAENKTTPEYAASKKLAKMLTIDFDEIAEMIDENPDITDVTQAILTFGINPDTAQGPEYKYLFKFFENIYYEQDPDKQFTGFSPDRVVKGHYGSMTDGWNNAVFDIADNRFRMQFQAKALYRDMKAGNIGQRGTYTGGVGEAEYPFTVMGASADEGIIYYTRYQKVKYYYYQHQVTEGLYIEIKVFGLESLYYVHGERYTTSDEIDDILLIPLDRTIIKDWTIAEKEKIYARSLHFIFNSMKVIKLKWYQTGIFSIIMVIVSAIISIVFPPAAGIALQFVVGLMATNLIVYVIVVAMINLFMSLVMGELLRVFTKALGAEIAFVIAIIGIAIGIAKHFDPNFLAGAPPWATHLLEMASNLKSTLISAGMEDLMDSLQGDWNSWIKESEELNKTLQAGQNLLKEHHYLSPVTIFGEKPEDFFNRTVHSGNTGATAITAIHHYVDSALQLPKLQDTLEMASNDFWEVA